MRKRKAELNLHTNGFVTGTSQLLVPLDVAHALRAEEEEAEQRRLAAARERVLAEQVLHEKTLGSHSKRPAHALHAASMRHRERRIPKNLRHILYSVDAIEKLAEANKVFGSRSEKDRAKVAALYDELVGRGGVRKLNPAPKDWREKIASLRKKHPNFSAVIDYLFGEFSLAEAMKQAPEPAPILLDGPPGVGKTMFAESLSQLMAAGFARFNFETAQTTSELTGSDEHWSNAKVGRLFSLLVEGEHGNPVVLIDEVDKAGGHGGYNVNSSLYALLERGTAKAWADLSTPNIKLDVSRVMWVLTSNAKEKVPGPLLSRMRVFDVPALSPDQARDVATQIFSAVARSFSAIGMSTDLPVTMAAVLATSSPREIHRISRELIAIAVADGRRTVRQDDLNRVDFDPATLAKWAIASQQISAHDLVDSQWLNAIVKH